MACICEAIGRDGTKEHSDATDRRFKMRENAVVIIPCWNHADCYAEAYFNYIEIPTIEGVMDMLGRVSSFYWNGDPRHEMECHKQIQRFLQDNQK